MIWRLKVELSFVAWSAARSGLETPLKNLKSFRIMILIANSDVSKKEVFFSTFRSSNLIVTLPADLLRQIAFSNLHCDKCFNLIDWSPLFSAILQKQKLVL